ncbi:zinc finger protein 772-like [Phyllostomus hastatus]|uniref:zinc finger protein 772-like n=1 Tax=Phyllostomus hastatus TaxID=9423 RepID=UPI001E685AE7|nr:zinc finger protein 772-like [Phyllostomus hastatus]
MAVSSQGFGTMAMAEATAQPAPDENLVTFQDLYICFTPEEWLLLDEGQRRLYCSVALETFLTAASAGLLICRPPMITQPGPVRQPNVPHRVDVSLVRTNMTQGSSGPGVGNRVNDENARSERGVSVRMSQVRTLQLGPSIQKSHRCDMCDPILKDILHLTGHQGTSPGQKLYPCKSCGRAFWFSVNRDQIPRQQSGETSNVMNNGQAHFVMSGRGPMSGNSSTDRNGGADFSASSGLAQHHTTHNVERPHQSTECEEAFHTEQRLYNCSECGKLFDNHSFFILHQKAHNKTTFYKCVDCGKLFQCSSSLEEHLKIHMDIYKPYKCSECGKSFRKNSHLMLHQKLHTGEKPYECSVCKKAFTRKTTLTQHEKIHSGEKPYICKSCGKAFLRKYGLTDHERVHTGEKAYECNECGKFFSSSTSLKMHKRLHSGTRPYVCNECGKTYIANSHLTQHKKVHTRSRPGCEENVENSLVETSASLHTSNKTLEQSLVCSAKVEERTEDAPTLCGS